MSKPYQEKGIIKEKPQKKEKKINMIETSLEQDIIEFINYPCIDKEITFVKKYNNKKDTYACLIVKTVKGGYDVLCFWLYETEFFLFKEELGQYTKNRLQGISSIKTLPDEVLACLNTNFKPSIVTIRDKGNSCNASR